MNKGSCNSLELILLNKEINKGRPLFNRIIIINNAGF